LEHVYVILSTVYYIRTPPSQNVTWMRCEMWTADLYWSQRAKCT